MASGPRCASPNYPRFCGQIFLRAKDKELALLCVKAYNDWMVDEWAGPSEGRLIPLCLIPLWDPAVGRGRGAAQCGPRRQGGLLQRAAPLPGAAQYLLGPLGPLLRCL